MIQTTRQLKDKIHNLSGGNSRKAQALLRIYMMERFLERVSVSKYNDNFVLKGGMLVSSLIGINTRATMDIDTTIRSFPLKLKEAKEMVSDIISIDLGDNIKFSITNATDIMEEHEYSGLRFILQANFENIKQTIKIDISTGDVITPSAISYSYKLMFEERSISIFTYNVETLLAEKLETIVSRGVANTRMRDFYDVYEIFYQQSDKVNMENLGLAFKATCQKRKTDIFIPDIQEIITNITESADMAANWKNYQSQSFYVDAISWDDITVKLSEVIASINDILTIKL